MSCACQMQSGIVHKKSISQVSNASAEGYTKLIMNSDRVLILGVTGSGKGRLAFELAQAVGGEIVSIDSMKVYRRMDIGTAKPPREALERIKYHLVDVVEPSESFSVGLFLDAALAAIEHISSRNKAAIAVGGTALYIKALLYGLFEGPGSDEQVRGKLRERAEDEGLEQLYHELERVDSLAAENIHPNDAKRIIRALEVYQTTGKPISSFQQQWQSDITGGWTIIGLRREKSDGNSRINRRRRILAGWRRTSEHGSRPSRTSTGSISSAKSRRRES
jgi:tRNA dimethylallyltransferase